MSKAGGERDHLRYFYFSGMSLAEQLQAKKAAGLNKAQPAGDGEASSPRPAAGPPKLDLIGEIKKRNEAKKKRMESGN